VLLAPPEPAPDRVLIAAAAGEMAQLRRNGGDLHWPYSPWAVCTGWRLQGVAETIHLWDDGVAPRQVTLAWEKGGFRVTVGGGAPRHVAIGGRVEELTLVEGDLSEAFGLTPEVDGCTIHMGGESWRLHRRDPLAPASEDAAGESRLAAPIPGRVVRLLVAAGDAVTKGQLLAVLEAMKTEIKITAARDGVIAHLGCAEGESIEEGTEIVSFVTAGTV
ncbi:MAG: biotin/lipoyl-binding protein, partial [Roseococcus sp.]|nr:biotin/lipoyl-binding protein [Roseococcus sp.]